MMQSSFSKRQTIRKPATISNGGIVAAQHRRAAEIGAAILAEGGDAVDAAVAVSFAIGVLEPWMSGIGGGGAMMLYRADRDQTTALDFGMRSSAELRAEAYPLAGQGIASDLFPWAAVEGDRNVYGGAAIAVPGTVAGMAAAHQAHGRMAWKDLVGPAAALAREGLLVDWYAALLIASAARTLAQNPAAAALFLEDGQWPTIFGWTAIAEKRIVMDRLAATLDVIAEDGASAFYEGDLAASIAAEVTEAGGTLSRRDLAAYRTAFQAPLVTDHRGWQVFSPPELTAGPTLHRALGSLAQGPVADPAAPATYVAYANALRTAQDERLTYMGDIEGGRGLPACTTHFSIVDRHGNMAAVTQTLLSVFGAKVVLPSTGMLMNNGVMWFDPEPGGPNSLGPDKRCLMNVCPVIGANTNTRFAVGASGGRKILSAVTQLCAGLIDHGLSLDEAFHRPRIDASGPTIIADTALPAAVHEALARHHPTRTAERLAFPYHFACPAGVLRHGDTNHGCTEPLSPWGEAVAENGA